jgi:alginate O-acetyltransferase complex protein AlgI
VFVLALIGSILVNTVLGIAAERTRGGAKKARAGVVAAACVLNLGFLFFFKYLNFAVRNINGLAGGELIGLQSVALPLGISFFTFQALSYVIDVARGDAAAEKNPLYVGLYISLFPQLVAGPILRYRDIAPQLRARRTTWEGFSGGACRFVSGLGKKILLANAFAGIADHIFDSSTMGLAVDLPVTLAWLGIVAYTLQIYHDFSAYSDMAIGLGRMFGFSIPENFNYPYTSRSVTEFWRRWHISLSTWFREYVYFPLGGSRCGSASTMRNTLIVWLLTGIWHGAEWTFVIWGLWHFTFILLERLANFEQRRIPDILRRLYLLFAVGVGWMFFRAFDLYQAFAYLRNMLGMNYNGFSSATALMFLREYWLVFLAGILFATPFARGLGEMIAKKAIGRWGVLFNVAYPAAFAAIFAASVCFLAKGSYNPFIYFNF